MQWWRSDEKQENFLRNNQLIFFKLQDLSTDSEGVSEDYETVPAQERAVRHSSALPGFLDFTFLIEKTRQINFGV